MTTKLDSFTRQYIETAFWSTNDESTEQGGEPLEANYSASDLAPETLAAMIADCAKFQEQNAAIMDMDGCQDAETCGHDFWLTRNGHGAGFWDGDYLEAVGDALTAAAKGFGECNLYVGDDGQIYL